MLIIGANEAAGVEAIAYIRVTHGSGDAEPAPIDNSRRRLSELADLILVIIETSVTAINSNSRTRLVHAARKGRVCYGREPTEPAGV